MSTLLGIDDNNYAPQPMKASGGGSTEDLTAILNAQDTLIANQETKIEQMVSALANKKSIDLVEETSDATATAGDIVSGKTAYVNGEKITGTKEDTSGAYFVASPLTSSSSSHGAYKVLKEIPDDVLTFTGTASYGLSLCTNLQKVGKILFDNVTDMYHFFDGCTNLTNVADLNLIGVEGIDQSFKDCISLVTAPNIMMQDVKYASALFTGCSSLTNIPVYNMSSINMCTNMFTNCTNLSNESLNNIMASLLTATNYTRTKTLAYIGLSSSQATTCTTLSNWSALQQAGWSTGY